MSFPFPFARSRRNLAIFLLALSAVGLTGYFLLTSEQPDSTTPVNGDAGRYEGPTLFRDRTSDSGIDFTYRNGEEADQYTILESLGGGVALFDYDGDGKLDLFATGGGGFEGSGPPTVVGRPNRLYRNLGGWRFQDVTEQVGMEKPVGYTHGVAVGDINRDGWADLLVTGYGRLILYENRSAIPAEPNSPRRRFVEVTREYGLPDVVWATSAAFGDLDGDGFPELYVCQYVDWSFANHLTCSGGMSKGARDICPPQKFAALPHRLFRNTGKGQFEDISERLKSEAGGKGLGVVIVDLNGDGLPDIYVANDASDNFLFVNRGKTVLEERGRLAGVAVDENGFYNGSMGIAAGDFNRSGLASLFVTNFEDEWHALYTNRGKDQFQYSSHPTGIARLGQRNVGFGTAFLDWDNDGWEDLVFVNGHVFRHPARTETRQVPILLRNEAKEGRRQFVRVGEKAGEYFQTRHHGRGLAVGDLDNDGWPDLVISHQNEKLVLLQNQVKETSESNRHWLGVELIGRNHRDLAGSWVVVEAAGEKQTRWVMRGGSYLSESDPRLLFGLDRLDRVDRLTVQWAYGGNEVLTDLRVDRYVRVVEGSK